MRNTRKLLGLLVLVIITGLFITGCASFMLFPNLNLLTVKIENNLSSVRPGGSLRFSASSRVTWAVSSTSDGSGPVTAGTGIADNGTLTVSVYETAKNLFVIATSVENGESVYKQIRVVTVTGVTVSPSNQSVARGGTQQFSASVTGANNPDNAVTWKVSTNIAGTGVVAPGTAINANGLLTVSANEIFTVLYVRAVSVVDPSKSGSAAVSVVVPTVTSVSVSPSNQSITRGGSLQFYSAVTGNNNPDNSVTWRVSSNAAGTGAVTHGTVIYPNGLLTVAANETASPLYVIATSVADTSKFGSVSVSVTIPTVTGVSVRPSNEIIARGGILQLYASVMGINNPDNSVIWRVSSNAEGTGAVTAGTGISANGLLTVAVNETSAYLFVIATSAADPSKSGLSIINIF